MPEDPPPDRSPDVCELQPLGDYEAPATPTEEALQQSFGRLRAFFRRDAEAPFIAGDQLQRVTHAMLDTVVAPPSYGPAFADVAQTVAAWREKRDPGAFRLIVMPPCENEGLLEAYADQEGHATLAPPPRRTFLRADRAYEPPPLDGEGLLVVPRLERWFLRHHNGLDAMRALLAALQESERRCVVGCSSWAWAYLAKALDADLLLPGAVTLQPFGAERLRAWFAQLAQRGTRLSLRLSASGADAFADTEESDNFFRRLAARSSGIPWVAWHLWRQSLFRDREDALEKEEDAGEDAGDDAEERRTLWVGTPDAPTLPGKRMRAALLVLHALLLHGALMPEEVRAVVPVVGEPDLVPALRTAGFVERAANGAVRCRAAAYPAIRAGLANDGFPLAPL